ncbi:MAG: DUF971 domain-containing protein [Acidobacteriota bacterium]|nr:MAG: DUF971 domain-containing protein [Acidobacteriota bacterium]
MSGPRPRAIEIFPNGEIGIAWDDGREDYLSARRLRQECPCAECVDEITGERRLDPQSVSESLRALSISPVGSYAVQFQWSDGHQTGLYAFDRLRQIAESQR